MNRTALLPLGAAVPFFAAVALAGAAPRSEQAKPSAKQKLATVEYLVGSWTCAHTVGTFSGSYTTRYTKALGDLWLRQTYDFPPQQFGGTTEPPVTGEALIGFDENRGQWVRFFANSTGQYFSIRMKETGNGWAYRYVSFFGTRPDAPEADATFTKQSPTQYVVDGPTYPENGKQVTEHHDCHKQ